ncbi:MAG TPA: PQQ-binding-like beta-propeller repeat protein [Pyrinomonadaceae bacterium]|nr:PQQ-binding-like beta-propeller repeat protein [Pyrinomonadaceae bacterium]
MKCGQVAVLKSYFTLPERVALHKMSHFVTPITRYFRSITRLFFAVGIIVSVSVLVRASTQIEEPKPYAKCWSIDSLADLSTSGAADKISVYFFAADGALEAVDQKSGARLWSTDLGGSVVSNLLLTDQSALFVTAGRSESGSSGKATLRSVSKQTGITTWSTAIQVKDSTTLGIVGDKVAAVNTDGLVSVFSLANGSLNWSQPIGTRVVAPPLFATDHLILGTGGNELLAVDMMRGVTSRMLRTGQSPTAIFVDAAGRILVGDARGNLALTSADGDRVWTFKNGAQISFLLPYDSEYLAASFDNFLYKISRGGNVEWKRRLSGRLSSRPAIIGNDGVISITGDPSVYVLDLTNGKIVNRIDIGGDENLSPRIVAAAAGGFAVAGSQGIQFFGREACGPNEKDGNKVPSGSGK